MRHFINKIRDIFPDIKRCILYIGVLMLIYVVVLICAMVIFTWFHDAAHVVIDQRAAAEEVGE